MTNKYRLPTPIDSGRIETDLGTFYIRENAVEVNDEETAEALHAHVSHLYRIEEVDDEDNENGDTTDADVADGNADDEDAPVCGTELDSGGTCERPAGDCPYHSE